MDKIFDFASQKEVYGLVIIFVIVAIIINLFNRLIDKLIRRSKNEFDRKRRMTVFNLFRKVGRYAVLALGIIFILDLYGINVSGLVASLGVVSAVLALSLQDTLKDIIGGATIITDNYYVEGDYIKYNNFTGQVIELGIRTTKIKNFDGEVYITANRNVNEVVNLSHKRASTLITIPTAYEEKTEKVEKIINEVIEEIRSWDGVIKEDTNYIGITELAESSVNYGIRFRCSIDKSWQYKRDALRLIKMKYDENNIKIPYNQIEVHNARNTRIKW